MNEGLTSKNLELVVERIALEAIKENGGSKRDEFSAAFIKQLALDIISRLRPGDQLGNG